MLMLVIGLLVVVTRETLERLTSGAIVCVSDMPEPSRPDFTAVLPQIVAAEVAPPIDEPEPFPLWQPPVATRSDAGRHPAPEVFKPP